MGLQAQIYAKAVAEEILTVINNGRELGDDDEQILDAVETKATEIRDAAKAGYY